MELSPKLREDIRFFIVFPLCIVAFFLLFFLSPAIGFFGWIFPKSKICEECFTVPLEIIG